MPSRIWLFTATILSAALIFPFFLTEIPPVMDYPNHLARAYLLVNGKADPVLAAMFQPHWAIIPNLASDIALPPILHLMPTYTAGKVFLAFSLLLPVLGGWLFSFSLFRRWSLWSLGVALVAFNLTFMLGFLNFEIGLGMAFLMAAAWVLWREDWPFKALAAFAAGAVIVFFCHLIALALLAILIGAYELDWVFDAAGRKAWRRIFVRTATDAVIFVPPLILYFLSPTSGAEGRVIWLDWSLKSLFVLAPFMTYRLGLDVLTGTGVLCFIVFALWKRWLLMPRVTAIAILIFGAAYLVSPYAIKGGAFFDTRFSIVVGYLVFVGIAEAELPATLVRGATVSFFALFGVRTGLIAFAWHEQAGQVAQMREAIQPIPAGSRVLVATVFPPDPADYWSKTPLVRLIAGLYVADIHLPALILIERHAFWQLLFSARSQQPITILPPYDRSAVAEMNWGPPSYDLLAEDWKLPKIQTKFPYLENWQSRFDFVLVLNAGGIPGRETFLSPQLSLLADTDVAALYRINPPAAPAPAVPTR